MPSMHTKLGNNMSYKTTKSGKCMLLLDNSIMLLHAIY